MMNSTRLVLGLCIVLSAVVATVGEVRPVACHPSAGIDGKAFSSAGDVGKASRPAVDSGTVHPKAVVMTFRGSSGRKISVAVDSAKADAKGPDTLRFDFTGKGRFIGAPTVAFHRPARNLGPVDYFQARFGPETIQATLPDRTVPIMVYGLYYRVNAQHRIQSLQMAKCVLCRTWAVLSCHGLRRGPSIPSRVNY